MEKKIYFTPQIELIVLDNEISLALESDPMELDPPFGPNETLNQLDSPFMEEISLD